MKHMQHTGPGYTGYDPGRGVVIKAATGQIVEVSDEKLQQLMGDFPSEWIVLGECETMIPPDDAPNVLLAETVTKPARANRRKAK